jgi:hypothetical protein
MLVARREAVAISFKGVGRYRSFFACAERCCVDERKMCDVKEVVGEESSRTGCGHHWKIASLKRWITGDSDGWQRRAGRSNRQEHETMGFGDTVGSGELSSTWKMRVRAKGGNFDADSRDVEPPPVVAALDGPGMVTRAS